MRSGRPFGLNSFYHNVRNLNCNQIDYYHQKRSDHHGWIRRNTHAFRSPARGISLIATYKTDHPPKKNDLMTAGNKSVNWIWPNAWEKNKTKDTSPLMFAPAQLPNMPSPSAYKIKAVSWTLRPGPRDDQKPHGVGWRYFHGVNLLRHSHGAQFRAHAGAYFPRANERRYDRPHFPNKGYRHHTREHGHGPETQQGRTRLNGQPPGPWWCRYRNERKRFISDLKTLAQEFPEFKIAEKVSLAVARYKQKNIRYCRKKIIYFSGFFVELDGLLRYVQKVWDYFDNGIIFFHTIILSNCNAIIGSDSGA